MSRGPGRIERKIAEVFMANPEKGFTTGMLCKIVWGDPYLWPDPVHRSSVLRAAGKVAARLGWIRFHLFHQANETCFISASHPLTEDAKRTLSDREMAYILTTSARTLKRDLAKPGINVPAAANVSNVEGEVAHPPQSQRISADELRFGISAKDLMRHRMHELAKKRPSRAETIEAVIRRRTV